MILKDLPDQRDRIYPGGYIAASSDLTRYLFKVEDQRGSSACGGEMLTSGVEMILRRFAPEKAVELSPLFAWWNARAIQGETMQNAGVYVRSLMKAAEKIGLCAEALWPFDESKYFTAPPAAAFEAAKNLRIKSYERCETISQIKAALTAELPVFLLLKLREGFMDVRGPLESHPVQFDGYLSRPKTSGHFMVAAGHMPAGLLLVQSYGPSAHGSGLVLVPWYVIQADGLDAWVITGIKTWRERVLGDAWAKVRGWFNPMK